MTAPVQLPHFQLGNTATDLSKAAADFVQGLKAEREQRKAEALQQALLGVRQLTAEAPLIEQQTKLGVTHRSADYYRQRYPELANAPDEPAIFGGEARERSDLMRERVLGTRRPIVAYDKDGNVILIEPGETGSPSQDSPGQAPQTVPQQGSQQPAGPGHAPIVPPGQPVRPTQQPRQSGWQNPKTHVVPGAGRSTTPGERNFAGAGRAAVSAHNDLSNIENAPNGEAVVNEIAAAISRPNFAQLIPFKGQQLSHVLQQFRLAGLSDQAQVYLKRLFDYAGTVGPKRYGLRGLQNEVTLQQLWTDFGGGQFGLGRRGITAAQLNRRNAALQMQEAGGPRAWEQSGDVFGNDQPFMPDTTGMTAPPPNTKTKYGYNRGTP